MRKKWGKLTKLFIEMRFDLVANLDLLSDAPGAGDWARLTRLLELLESLVGVGEVQNGPKEDRLIWFSAAATVRLAVPWNVSARFRGVIGPFVDDVVEDCCWLCCCWCCCCCELAFVQLNWSEFWKFALLFLLLMSTTANFSLLLTLLLLIRPSSQKFRLNSFVNVSHDDWNLSKNLALRVGLLLSITRWWGNKQWKFFRRFLKHLFQSEFTVFYAQN